MAVNKVEYGGSTLIDLTSDTVTADNLLSGYTAHDKSGTLITGTLDPYKPEILVVVNAAATVSVVVGDSSAGVYLQPSYHEDNVWMYEIPYYGTWTVGVSSMFGNTSQNVVVDTVKIYKVEANIASSFEESSWATIQYATKNGYASGLWQVGDTKTYQDTSGNTRTVEIVDIGDNNIVLDLASLYASGALAVQTGPTSGYTINWPYDTFLPSLPQDFKSVVTSSTYFSSAEIFGASPLQLFSTASGRSKGVAWWTNTTAQSGSMPSNTYSYYVTASGTQSSDRMTNSHYYNAKITIS